MSFVIVGAGLVVAGGAARLGVSLAGRKDRINEQKAAIAEQEKMKKEYENLDTSNLAAGFKNPYQNLENTFEDLTVNQQQAQFEAQQFQQSQANIMQNLQGAAGGSGIAGLAQTLANQGILNAQRSSASIGMQEAQNQRMAAGQAARNQAMEAGGEQFAQQMRIQGATQARSLEYDKTSTLFGMSQQRLASANEARIQAAQDQMAAIGDMASAGAQIATAGMNMPKLPDAATTTPTDYSKLTSENVYGKVDTFEMDPNQLKNRPIVTTQQDDSNVINVGGGSGPSFLYKKTDLKINKNK
tara:strand:+ start:4486 stop:5382 length:897 start_codon:yes stop_codon:yes gene_type:complete